jgi:hypothetical protein
LAQDIRFADTQAPAQLHERRQGLRKIWLRKRHKLEDAAKRLSLEGRVERGNDHHL